MKTIAPAAMAAIVAGEAVVTGAAQISPRDGSTPIRVWGGYGPITIDGNEYQGIGNQGLAQETAGAIGGVAQGLTLTLSGVDPTVAALVDPDELRGASVVLYRLIFASDAKTLLDAHVFDRGRVDTVDSDYVPGGTATISLAVESAARSLGRSLARVRSDADQRLIDATDGYFKNTAFAGSKKLYWGGKKPSRAADSLSPPSGNYGS